MGNFISTLLSNLTGEGTYTVIGKVHFMSWSLFCNSIHNYRENVAWKRPNWQTCKQDVRFWTTHFIHPWLILGLSCPGTNVLLRWSNPFIVLHFTLSGSLCPNHSFKKELWCPTISCSVNAIIDPVLPCIDISRFLILL